MGGSGWATDLHPPAERKSDIAQSSPHGVCVGQQGLSEAGSGAGRLPRALRLMCFP